MIGGNISATVQIKKNTGKNNIGGITTEWHDFISLTGFLDLLNGDSKYSVYSSKVQESSHIFICDYADLSGITSENSRIICNEKVYEILLIDDPMELHEHIEFYLKYIGGQD